MTEQTATVTTAGSVIPGRVLCRGEASGPLLVLSRPLSFWGGVNHDGRIIDAHHPQLGLSVTGTVLAMSAGRGSSSSSSVLAELIRADTAPFAILLLEPDAIIALGALAAAELYDAHCPIVQIDPSSATLLHTGLACAVSAPAEAAPEPHPSTPPGHAPAGGAS